LPVALFAKWVYNINSATDAQLLRRFKMATHTPALDTVITKVQAVAAQYQLPLQVGQILRRGPVSAVELVQFNLFGDEVTWRFTVALIPETYTIDMTAWEFKSRSPMLSDTDVQLRLLQRPHNWELAVDLVLSHIAFQ
jgi:hypothetical protein